jgi:hypothetical protein
MRHLVEERNSTSAESEKESAAYGGSRKRREEANTGEELFAVLERSLEPGYLETFVAEIAVSWARASRASMVANITLPPRRRRTIIPASCGRMLATPCAWGRISVTVDLGVTMENEATPVPRQDWLLHQGVSDCRIEGVEAGVTRSVS